MTQNDQEQEYIEDDIYADDAAYDAELVDPDLDEAMVDEWAELDMAEPQNQNTASPKKKSGLFSPFNLVVIIGAVAVGGFFMWKTLSGAPATTSPAEQQVADMAAPVNQTPDQTAQATTPVLQPEIEAEYPQSPQQPAATDEAPVVPDATTGGFVGDPSKLVKADAAPQPDGMVPMPPPAADVQQPPQPEAAQMTAPTAEPAPMAPDAPAPVAATPETQPALMTAPEEVSPAVAPQPEAPVTPPQAEPAPVPTPAPEVAQAPKTEMPAPVQAVPDATPKTEPVKAETPDPQIAELRAEIERLKSELDAAKTAQQQSVAAVEAAPQDDHVADLAPTPAPEKVVMPKVKKPDTRKSVVKKATSTWELRSAKTGSAMIARKGESDLQMVSIGDSVSGLGRITDIRNDGGRWIVQGTSGRLMQ